MAIIGTVGNSSILGSVHFRLQDTKSTHANLAASDELKLKVLPNCLHYIRPCSD